MLPHVVPERLVRDLAEHLRTQPLPPTRDGLLADLLHMVACKAAIKAGQPLSPAEIAALLERRHLVADSHHCPHGRPTALVFTKADLCEDALRMLAQLFAGFGQGDAAMMAEK